jgi:hypothetical protein
MGRLRKDHASHVAMSTEELVFALQAASDRLEKVTQYERAYMAADPEVMAFKQLSAQEKGAVRSELINRVTELRAEMRRRDVRGTLAAD